MLTFNLKRYLEKTANYEGVQGYWKGQTRAWQNCCKAKLDKGSNPQKAWQGCLDEYQTGEGNMAWAGKYAADSSPSLQKQASEMAPYHNQIMAKIATGKTTAQAVMETIKELARSTSVSTEK